MSSTNIKLAVNNEPEFLNNSQILGTEPEGLGEFLSREASFLSGELWGAKDRRNTQDGDWKLITLPWVAWIEGKKETKNTPAWGFSRHPVGKHKAGASIVLGSSIGGARKAKAMDTMFAMGLDVDSGAKLDDVLDKLEEEGILCFVYTSFNNGKRGIELKRDEVLRKMQITRDPEESEVRQFLREHDKNRYEEAFIAECKIKEQKHQTTDGVKIVLDTPPLEKFRLIFPLAEPVKIIDLAETHEAALAIWENKITGLAQNVLGVHFDTSCTDPSRLFYTARHPKGADDWYAAVVMGSPLNFDAIEEFKKSTYTSNREINAFTMAGSETAGSRAPQCYSPSGLNLNDWNRHAGKNFLLADLLEDHCPDRIRGQNGDKLEIECPFEHIHSETGGTACFVMNSIDSNTEHWIWKCHHDSCQGRHRLEFLEEALRAGWFDEALLSDAAYLLEGPDELECQDAASTDIETANPLESVYDERLVDPSGFLRRPEDAAPLYDALGVKVPREGADEYSDKLERAYAKMVTILRDQIKEAMRTRFSYVVTPDGAKAAIRIAKGTPPVFYSEAALERLFRNREVSYFNDEDKVKKLQPHTLFFYDRERETFDGTCFEPTASAVPEHKFNIWTGFTVEPKQGDWSKLRDHVRGVLCGGDDMLFQWFMTWIASPFARPGVKVPSSVAIRGEQGTGKSKLFDWLREAMGCAAMKVSQGKHLTGSFNAHLDGKLLLVCEEAFWAGDRAAAGVIKDLITADELTVEAKFENAVTRPNRLSVAFISNNSWIVPTDGKDARRFLVLEASDARKEDAAYFKAIDKQMREGGLEAMVYDLVNWDPANIGGWDVLRKPPKTDGLRQQARMGLNGPMAELIGIIEEGILSGKTTDGDAFYYDLSDKESTRVARSHVNAVLGIKKGRGNETVEGRAALEELLGNDANHRSKDVIHYRGEMQDGSRVEKRTDARVLYVEFPPLEELRSELVDYGEDR